MCPSRIHWHSDRDVYQTVNEFYNNFACPPHMFKIENMHAKILEIFKRELRKEGISPGNKLDRFEYVGSSYEGGRVKIDGYEFDIQVVLNGGNNLTAIRCKEPGYYYLKPKKSWLNPFCAITEEGYISSCKARVRFRSRLREIIEMKASELSRFKVKKIVVENNGPASTMKFEDRYGETIYSVDMVPTIEIDGKHYVPKRYRIDGIHYHHTWRRSYSVEEREKFDDMEENCDDCCHLKVLGVCKAMRAYRPDMKEITSYHLKNALFHYSDELSSKNNWNEAKLAERVVGLWKKIEHYLSEDKMPSYFKSKINLLKQMPVETEKSLLKRIPEFLTSKTKFFDVINRISTKFDNLMI